MPTQQIKTEHGNVELRPLPDEILTEINRYWPMPVVRGNHEGDVVYALGFQQEDRHVFGLKVQQVECSEHDALVWMQLNAARVAYGAPGYLRAGLDGVLVTVSYMREKGEDKVEPGIALFAGPASDGPEQKLEPPLEHIDKELGPGFSAMAVTLVDHWRSAGDEKLLPLVPIDLDVRARPQLGQSRLDMMFVGRHAICLRRSINEEDPFWGHCADAGLTSMLHMPSVPANLTAGG